MEKVVYFSYTPAGFVPFEAYARAKLMTVTAGHALARGLAADGVTVNAVHPGIVATDIIDDLVPALLRPFGGLIRRTMLTPAEGAAAALRLATDPDLAGVTGRYFNHAAGVARRGRSGEAPRVEREALRRMTQTVLASRRRMPSGTSTIPSAAGSATLTALPKSENFAVLA
jgi:NAD(P)-dependent dehydrogenase (short-subunit alcohol dehydrogenase family)